MKTPLESDIFERWRARQDSVTSRDLSAAVFRKAKNMADAFRIHDPLVRRGAKKRIIFVINQLLVALA